MLKRLLVVLVLALVLCAALAVPLRREYSFIKDARTGQIDQLTEVHYGIPKTWLTLGKEVDSVKTDEVRKSYRQHSNRDLAIDVVFWIVTLGVAIYVSRATRIKIVPQNMPPNRGK